MEIGHSFQKLVLKVASLLKDPASPGLVSLLLIIALWSAIWLFWSETAAQRNAIIWLKNLVSRVGNDFSMAIDDLTRTVREGASTPQRRAISIAWHKYYETLVLYEEDGEIVLRNSVRPAHFFGSEDIGFSPGFWRAVPGLFVSIGLFLTFLGLVAALDSMAGEAITPATMVTLLSLASAKFIMSLMGLLCAIIFTIILHYRLSWLDRAAYQLCAEIESHLTFISLEALGAEQLRATREQREHFRTIGFELVAELGRPLREEVPKVISSSIGDVLGPLVEKLQQRGVENVDAMVKDLSAQFSDGVGSALTSATSSFSDAGAKVAEVSNRMDLSSERMGVMLETAVQDMSKTIADLRLMSDAVQAGADASHEASVIFRSASTDFVAALTPVREAHERVDRSIEGLRELISSTTKAVTESAGLAAQSASGALASIEKIFGEELNSVQSTMSLVNETLQGLKLQGDRLGDMDEKLGQAFKLYTDQVEVAMFGMRDHVAELQGQLAPALDRMREIVDKAEEFMPQSGRS